MKAGAATTPPLATVLVRYRGREPKERRPRGRPTKRTPDYLRALLVEYAAARAWYLEAKGHTPRSDTELLRAYCAELFQRDGQGAWRASDSRFKGPLKTALNELSMARRMFPHNSICREG